MHTNDKLGIIKAICFALATVAAFFVIQIGIVIFFEIIFQIFFAKSLLDSDNGQVMVSMVYAIISSLLAAGAYYLINKKGKPTLGKKGITSLKRIGIIFVFGLTVQFFLSDMLNVFYEIVGDTKLFQNYKEIIESLDGSKTPLIYFYTCFMAPVSEEYIFRGVIYSYMRKHTPMYIANFLQAALFGLYHGNVIQGIYAFVGGLIFGYVAEHKKSMLELILFHMFVNIFGVFVTPAVFFIFENVINPLLLYMTSGIISLFVLIILIKRKVLLSDEKEVGIYEDKS